MSLDAEFNKAAEDIRSLTTSPTDLELLELYSLFKQATVGDCNTSRPGMFDLKGKAKWDAWDARKGLAQDEAKRLYIEKVKELMNKYSGN